MNTLARKKAFNFLESAQHNGWYFNGFLLVLTGVIIIMIAWIKSNTVANFFSDPLLLGYTFFVTLFQMSRIGSALLYERSYRDVATQYKDDTYTPTVSFVVPCMNEEGAIYNTIENCFKAEYPKHLMEVIVINDGSTDGTLKEILRAKAAYPSLIVVDWKENKGKRHGMAEGFRRANGEIVIQLDSDSYIEPSTFRAFITPFKNPEIGAISAHTDPLNPDENLLTKMQTAYYFMSFRILKAAESTFHVVFCCSGCASAYRKSAVLPVLDEWLEESFLGLPVTWGDDRAITNQVIKQGYRTLYTDEVRAYTIVPNQFKQFIKQQIRWKKGWFVNSLKASRFIVKREPFVAFTYFFPLIAVTLLTPFMAARAFIYTPLVKGPSATMYYVLGVLCITFLIMIVYRFFARDNRYWPYLFFWALINMVLLSYLLLYALATIQDRGWNTRAPVPSKA
jgi:hyaluronan synthase